MTNRRYHIVVAFVCGTLLSVSALATSLGDNPGMVELANNSEYTALMERNKQLSQQADSINRLLSERRTAMTSQDESIDIETIRAEIIALEQQAHDNNSCQPC